MTDQPFPPAAPRLRFRSASRLTLAREYQAAYKNGLRQMRGPLVVYGRLSGLARPRLGLSVSRRVGNAVVRNRIKRLLREAFRLNQLDLPTGVDLVVSVRPHGTLPLARYVEILLSAASALERDLRKREREP